MAVSQDVEEQLPAGTVEGDKAQLVEDEQVDASEPAPAAPRRIAEAQSLHF